MPRYAELNTIIHFENVTDKTCHLKQKSPALWKELVFPRILRPVKTAPASFQSLFVQDSEVAIPEFGKPRHRTFSHEDVSDSFKHSHYGQGPAL